MSDLGPQASCYAVEQPAGLAGPAQVPRAEQWREQYLLY